MASEVPVFCVLLHWLMYRKQLTSEDEEISLGRADTGWFAAAAAAVCKKQQWNPCTRY